MDIVYLAAPRRNVHVTFTLAFKTMPNNVCAQDVFAYHKVTQCPLSDARAVLEEIDPVLLSRILHAVKENSLSHGLLYDPIEDDPELSPIIKSAEAIATERIRSKGSLRMGSCHAVWREQAKILLEEYQIVWFSLQQMNPGVCFD